MILQNQVRCKKCLDEPFSASRHDFKSCKCGSIAVDGGLSYLRRVGNLADAEDMSITMPDDVVTECLSAITQATESGRNSLGILCAVARVLKKYDQLKEASDANS